MKQRLSAEWLRVVLCRFRALLPLAGKQPSCRLADRATSCISEPAEEPFLAPLTERLDTLPEAVPLFLEVLRIGTKRGPLPDPSASVPLSGLSTQPR
jgi:hypothetical protein